MTAPLCGQPVSHSPVQSLNSPSNPTPHSEPTHNQTNSSKSSNPNPPVISTQQIHTIDRTDQPISNHLINQIVTSNYNANRNFSDHSLNLGAIYNKPVPVPSDDCLEGLGILFTDEADPNDQSDPPENPSEAHSTDQSQRSEALQINSIHLQPAEESEVPDESIESHRDNPNEPTATTQTEPQQTPITNPHSSEPIPTQTTSLVTANLPVELPSHTSKPTAVDQDIQSQPIVTSNSSVQNEFPYDPGGTGHS